MDFTELRHLAEQIETECGKAIIGKGEQIRLVLTSLFAGGHVLIDDIPGVGKTTLVKALSAVLGCGMVGTETGAPNAEYKFCPECRSDAALATFIKNFKPVVSCAEQYGVTIAIEPVVRHIVYDARRARTVLDEIGSPNLQILLDPVNLLNMENVDQREEVFAETIELLGKDVAMIHFKDFLLQDADGQLAATGAGQGGMGDYRTILRFAKEQKPYVFATLENTTPENAVQCLQYLQKQYDEC